MIPKPNLKDPCVVDLSKHDKYPARIIPDADVEITLKVLRSLRDWHLEDAEFDEAVLLSHAHACIYESVQACLKAEADALSKEAP